MKKHLVRLHPYSNSELLLERGAWDVIDTIWLLDALVAWHLGTNTWHLAVTNKWHCTAAIGGLWRHGVDTNNHSDNSAVKEQESNDADSHNTVEEDLVLWLPLDVSILIDLRRHTSGARSD